MQMRAGRGGLRLAPSRPGAGPQQGGREGALQQRQQARGAVQGAALQRPEVGSRAVSSAREEHAHSRRVRPAAPGLARKTNSKGLGKSSLSPNSSTQARADSS